MFNFNKRSPQQSASQKPTTKIGTTSNPAKATPNANAGFRSESGSTSSPSMGKLDVNLDTSLLLEGMDSELRDKQLFRVYRDMYWHDPVCGSCADLYSTLPFSEFSIGGATDKYLAPYREAIEVLNLRSAMPRISVDHQVTGAFCGSILYNQERSSIYDLMAHRYDNISIHSLPLFSQDPLMFLKLDQEMKTTLGMKSKRIDMIREQMGEPFFKSLLESELELDPIGTIYAPRKTFSYGEGVSYFKRVLPLWMIEKNLYRGTLIESGRRQRGILHLMLGEEGWQPQPEDFDLVTNLFMDADADPIGAVVATRLGISVSELRQGGDFWKITDIWDQTSAMKMRALGINEAFLSGDATYANMEGSMTVFMETLRAYRDMMTRKVFYEKVFPLVSLLNGYTQKNNKITTKTGLMEGNTEEILRRMQDGSKLFIPTVHWAKQLKPEQDQAYMEVLSQLTEKGIPVPLRALAAAGGFNLDQLLLNRDEDLAVQRQLLDYNRQLEDMKGKYAPKSAEGGAEGGGMGSFSSAVKPLTESAVLGSFKQPSLMTRDFGEESEIYELTRTGKKRHVVRQSHANKVANDKIIRAVQNIKRFGNGSLFGSATPMQAKHGQVFKY